MSRVRLVFICSFAAIADGVGGSMEEAINAECQDHKEVQMAIKLVTDSLIRSIRLNPGMQKMAAVKKRFPKLDAISIFKSMKPIDRVAEINSILTQHRDWRAPLPNVYRHMKQYATESADLPREFRLRIREPDWD